MAVVVSGSFSPSPAARACSDLKADVASYVNATNSSRALAKAEDCIRAAVARLNTRKWAWSLVYQDITLVADDADYDLAAPFNYPRKAELLNASGKALAYLSYRDPQTFTRENSDRTTSGTPMAYTIDNPHEYGQIVLDVAPGSGFVTTYPTLRLWYFQKVAPCGGSTTSLDVPFEVAEWVAWQAKSLMAGHHDPQKVSMARSEAGAMWSDLLRQQVNYETSDWS